MRFILAFIVEMVDWCGEIIFGVQKTWVDIAFDLDVTTEVEDGLPLAVQMCSDSAAADEEYARTEYYGAYEMHIASDLSYKRGS